MEVGHIFSGSWGGSHRSVGALCAVSCLWQQAPNVRSLTCHDYTPSQASTHSHILFHMQQLPHVNAAVGLCTENGAGNSYTDLLVCLHSQVVHKLGRL